MKSTHAKPQFDAEGYQIGMRELNGERLPDTARLRTVSRRAAGLPPAAAVRAALGALEAAAPATYVRARETAGLTQEQFAAAIGVKVSTYRQWEHGRRRPTGPAVALLRLLASRPVLLKELRQPA